MIRTYQGINLMDLLDIQSRVNENKLVLDTSAQTMLQNYNGLTFF